MRLRFAVALAAVAAAWYATRPEQASNVARVGDLAGTEARAVEEPRWSRSTPPPVLPPIAEVEAPEPEPLEEAVIVRDVQVERRFSTVLGPSEDDDEVRTMSSGVAVENEYLVDSPAPPDEAAAVSFSCGGGTSNNVYYVEGIDLTGLTFD